MSGILPVLRIVLIMHEALDVENSTGLVVTPSLMSQAQ